MNDTQLLPTFEPAALISIVEHPEVEFHQMIYGLSVVAMLISSLIVGYFFTKVSLVLYIFIEIAELLILFAYILVCFLGYK